MAFCPATDDELGIYSVKDSENTDLRRRLVAGKVSTYTAKVDKASGS